MGQRNDSITINIYANRKHQTYDNILIGIYVGNYMNTAIIEFGAIEIFERLLTKISPLQIYVSISAIDHSKC